MSKISCWCYDCKKVFYVEKNEDELCPICNLLTHDSKSNKEEFKKLKVKITDKQVKKEEIIIPKNRYKVSIWFNDVRESEELNETLCDNEEELEDMLLIISFLEEVELRLKKNWNKYCNLGHYEFDDLIGELGLSDVLSCDDLEFIPSHEEYESYSIMGRLGDYEVTWFDENGVEFECEIDRKRPKIKHNMTVSYGYNSFQKTSN